VYASSTTIRQFDLKVIVAYSSIAHMASSLLGTFSDTLNGIVGSIIFGISHGFVSPGLFILVGAVLYDRCGSRIINYYKGLSNLTPLFAIIFLILIFGNMGVPLTGNFIGEFLSLLGAYQQNIFVASVATTSVILSAVYSIYTYIRVTSGSVSPHVYTIPDLYRKEYYILLPLLVLTIILGILPSIITTDIEFAISHCLLFSISPVVFNDNDDNEKDVQKLHETNCNPHNTPVVNNVLPPSSSRNLNPSINNEDNRANTSNSLQVGNPNSEEGNTPFIALEDKKNKAVDPQELTDKIEDHLVESELKSNMNN
jgi:NADH:ubiquinone oxidoreductase subunit 5 (subunit L)/multisubunit Na+/H+ antiporter MnhA subunit